MADAIHTTDQTGNNLNHVTQFHPITVNHICFRYISCHIDIKKSISKLVFFLYDHGFFFHVIALNHEEDIVCEWFSINIMSP
jgi:hypothetical protein